MTNEENNGVQTPPAGAVMTPEDKEWFEKIKAERIEKERKEKEEKERKAKRDEVWTNFKADESYKALEGTGFDKFINENPEFLDSQKLLASAVKQHKLEMQLKQKSNGGTAGETTTEESVGEQSMPGKGTSTTESTKKYDINSQEFMDAFSRGEVSWADIQKMDITPETKILLKTNAPRPHVSGMNKFFGGGTT